MSKSLVLGRRGTVAMETRSVEVAYRAPRLLDKGRIREMRRLEGVGLPEEAPNPREAYRATLQAGAAAFAGEAPFLPDTPGGFKRHYYETLVDFRIARRLDPNRVGIAEAMIEHRLDAFRYGHPIEGVMSVREAALIGAQMGVPTLPAREFRHPQAGQARGMHVGMEYGGEHYDRLGDLTTLADRLVAEGAISEGAAQRLSWLDGYAFSEGREGYVHVRDTGVHERTLVYRRGGAAELGTAVQDLLVGNDVHVSFTRRPSMERLLNRLVDTHVPFAGRLTWAVNGTNLTGQLPESVATVRAVAAGRDVFVGQDVYAGGGGREAYLAVAAMAEDYALGSQVSGWAAVNSPSNVVHEIPMELAERIIAAEGAGNIIIRGGRAFVRSFSSDQGDSGYQELQAGKVEEAEVGRTLGFGPVAKRRPAFTSHDVGPIADSLSMDTVVFQGGFRAAGRWGVRIASPELFRELSFRLRLAEQLNPAFANTPRKGEFDDPATAQAGRNEVARELEGAHADFGVFGIGRDFNEMIRTASVVGNLGHPLELAATLSPKLSGPLRVAHRVQASSGPRAVEAAARTMRGPLAEVLLGARDIRLGDASALPPAPRALQRVGLNTQRLLGVAAGANRWAGGPVLQFAGANTMGLYGGAVTSHLFGQLHGHRTGNYDQITLLSPSDRDGVLSEVRVQRDSGEHVGWRDTGRTTEDGRSIVEQVVYLGRSLPSIPDPSELVSEVVTEFAYDPVTRTLQSLGPRAVDEGILDKVFDFEPHVVEADAGRAYARLVASPGQEHPMQVDSSLTFPANSGILGNVLRDVVFDSESGIDFTRVMVHGVDFRVGTGDVPIGAAMETQVIPVAVRNTSIGQIVNARIEMSPRGGGGPFNVTTVNLVVRNNFPHGSRGDGVEKVSRPKDRHLDQGGAAVPLVALSRSQLGPFADINGDHNPLHRVDAVGWAAGMPGVVNPGFGTLGQVEAALRAHYEGQALIHLTGDLGHPALPGREYRLEVGLRDVKADRTPYQVVDPKPNKRGERKVLVDGSFRI